MKHNKLLPQMIGLMLVLLLLVACGASPPATTTTSTPVPPTAIPTPTLAPAHSQASEWLVYDTENSGLPQNHVIALASDIQGDLWIGTRHGGLAKFDRETWTVYNTDNSGLPSDQVTALAFDAQGTLWIGTGGGLAKFDGETWTVYTTDNSDLPYDPIHELVFDTQGNLWIGTGRFYELGGGGLAKFDGGTWVIYTKDNSRLPGNQILALAVDPLGNLWAGTEGDNGVAKFDGETWTAYTADNTELQWGPVPALTFDAQGKLWVANNWYGVSKFDGANWMEYTPKNSELPSISFHSGHVFDEEGNLWIATERGVVKFDGQSWMVYDEDNSGLPENHISIITIDAHGNKWFGTYGGGLAAYREGGVILSDEGAELKQSTDIPEPTIATVDDLIGIWERGPVEGIDYQFFPDLRYNLYLQINEDGTFRGVPQDADLLACCAAEEGQYRLEEGTLLTFIRSNESSFCKGMTGTYETKLVAENKLQFVLRDDPCPGEDIAMEGGEWSRISP